MSFSEISIRNVCLDHQPVTFSYLANCFISNKTCPFLTPSLKITSGEISAKEVAGESTGKVKNEQINSNEHHRQEVIKSVSTSRQFQSFQKYSSKIKNTASSKPAHQYTNRTVIQPVITHPEERIWAGRTPRRQPRVPDAPKIKHDKMKQFYMVDMERKMW